MFVRPRALPDLARRQRRGGLSGGLGGLPVIVWLYGGSLIAGSDVSYPHLENLALPPGRLVANFLRLGGGGGAGCYLGGLLWPKSVQ